MKHAETVTFGGSGLDRAAHERKDVQSLWLDPTVRLIVLWRGKPMVTIDHSKLVTVEVDHDIVAGASAEHVYLGRDNGTPVFAIDISAWEPEAFDDTTLDTFLDPSEQAHPTMKDTAVFAELRAIMTHLSPRDAELAATARAIFGWHASHRFCSTCGHLSDFAMGGWQRNCPACARSHFPRTDPVVIMLITRGDSVLVGRSPGWPEGMYSLLAGFVEPGETLEAAVRREVMEESGITVGAVSYLASQPWPFPASLMFGCMGEALDDDITVDVEELEDAMWISRADMHIVFAGQHPVMKPARKGAIAHFLLDNWLSNTLD
ncbi:NAD(+) diphosphatase [Loktanella sp. F6476L]|uniref:NAD(+) diphosphatase n=1 Tax=Loktanella sp. F6476L TaxID=2926405 RepID=UPI001FF4CF63|nr:NAD(+) diphosphatase [Loktanella sp. F6476L]MCK0121105.1 NAD(+) diphosphatase [Loktanella sp. F6476L]